MSSGINQFTSTPDRYNQQQLTHDKMDIKILYNTIENKTEVTVYTKLNGKDRKIDIKFNQPGVNTESIKKAIVKELFRESITYGKNSSGVISSDGRISRDSIGPEGIKTHVNTVSKKSFFEKHISGPIKKAFINLKTDYSKLENYNFDNYEKVDHDKSPGETWWKPKEQVITRVDDHVKVPQEDDSLTSSSQSTNSLKDTTETYSEMNESDETSSEIPESPRVVEQEVVNLRSNNYREEVPTGETPNSSIADDHIMSPGVPVDSGNVRNPIVNRLSTNNLIKAVKEDTQNLGKLLGESRANVKSADDRDKIADQKQILRSAEKKLLNELKALENKASNLEPKKGLELEASIAKLREKSLSALQKEFKRLTELEGQMNL